MNTVATVLSQFFGDLNIGFGAYLAGLASLSVLTMALVQAAKDLTPVRRLFMRRQLRAWLAKQASAQFDTIEPELVAIVASGDERAFYDMELDELRVAIVSSLQVLLEYPNPGSALLGHFAAQVEPRYLRLVECPTHTDREALREARNVVMHHVKNAVAAFALVASSRWKFSLQITSQLVSSTLAFVALMMWGRLGASWDRVLVSAVLAGLLAPVARDLLVALQQIRR